MLPLMIITTAATSNAQGNKLNLQKKIVLPVAAMRLDSLMSTVSRQSGARFSLNTRKFPPSRLIRLTKGTQPLGQLLAEIRNNTGIYYTILGEHIIFIDNPPAVKTARIKKMPAPPVKSSWQPLVLHALPVTYRAAETAFLSKDTIKHLPAEASPPGNAHQDKNIVLQQRRAGNNKNLLPILLNAGVSAEEVFYMNGTIQAGSTFLYGIVSAGTNFKLSCIRWGAGTSVGIGNQWRLHLQVTTGKMERPFDSLNAPRTAKQRQLRYSLVAGKQIGARLRLQVGLGLNNLVTRYYSEGKPFVQSRETMARVFKELDFIHPPYTISNGYTLPAAKNVQRWIGFQAGIFYNLNFFKKE